MATVTFDTLAYAGKFREAGIPDKQAEAMVRAQADALSAAMENQLATKADITHLDRRMDHLAGELKNHRWMIGPILAGVVSLVLKAFFIG